MCTAEERHEKEWNRDGGQECGSDDDSASASAGCVQGFGVFGGHDGEQLATCVTPIGMIAVGLGSQEHSTAG